MLSGKLTTAAFPLMLCWKHLQPLCCSWFWGGGGGWGRCNRCLHCRFWTFIKPFFSGVSWKKNCKKIGVEGRLEFSQKFIRFGSVTRPWGWCCDSVAYFTLFSRKQASTCGWWWWGINLWFAQQEKSFTSFTGEPIMASCQQFLLGKVHSFSITKILLREV